MQISTCFLPPWRVFLSPLPQVALQKGGEKVTICLGFLFRRFSGPGQRRSSRTTLVSNGVRIKTIAGSQHEMLILLCQPRGRGGDALSCFFVIRFAKNVEPFAALSSIAEPTMYNILRNAVQRPSKWIAKGDKDLLLRMRCSTAK